MYCGMSLGRVGLDFRPLLAPPFEQAILAMFAKVGRDDVASVGPVVQD